MATPTFIDAAYAAETLHVPVEMLLDLVGQGRLRTYGGRSSNPFLRSAEVAALAEELELGAGQDAGAARRVKSPSTRVQQRITADARWGDITESDLREWVARADAPRRQAAAKAARNAVQRLEALLQMLEKVRD